MEAPSHISGARPGHRVQRRRSKAQRDRQRGPSPANSSSSTSPAPELWPRPQRKRRKRRGADNVNFKEDDLIDGFCISSYGSLEAMQRDFSANSAPHEEPYRKRPPGKRKRSDEASSEDPGASGPENRVAAYKGPRDCKGLKDQKRNWPAHNAQEGCAQHVGPPGVISQDCLHCCLDTGYICDAESSCDEQTPRDDLALSFTISTSTASVSLSGGRPKLSVLCEISGLGRSCERSQEPECEPLLPQLCPTPLPPRTPLPPPKPPPSTTPKAQPAPAVPAPTVGLDLGMNSSSRCTFTKPLSVPRMSPRPPTPSRSLPGHSAPQGFSSALRPQTHHHLSLFAPAPAPALPPPPPLLQVTGHPASAVTTVLSAEHNVIGQEMGSRFVAAPGAGAELSAAVRPMYQFHQHNHQHTHQHTHQHFTPFPPAVASATFEKYPGKIESLYRQNFFQPFSPVITALPPVLPPSVSFGSLQGAFQPKSTSSELASRCSVPPSLPHKAPQRSGRWCAMHVRLAYMILRHQERIKLAHGTPHKPPFRSDLLSCLPAGLSSLPSSHELARTSSLFTGSPGHFQVSPQAAAPFLPPSGPVDPFIRTSGFSPLAALNNGAFGGLGNPSYNPPTMFNRKDGPAIQGFPNPHDPWNRLHRTPPSFPTAPPQICAKPDLDAHSVPLMKNEKDRDLFCRLAPHISPLTSSQRLPGGEERGPSRTVSPYMAARHGSSSDIKPRLTPDHSKVKVKEEPEVLTFEVGRSPVPGLHLSHPSPPFERLRGPFLGEQFPHALEPWRDVYRRVDPQPLRLPSVSPRLYEREERAHILREDFERAHMYGLPPHHAAMQPSAASMLGALYPHPASGLLSKTPPINLLSAPPPLISTSRPGSPHHRDLYKERDSR
ncbi:hypothetical protein XENTR_v10023720 [Xenopus tropicalis]|uniref:Fibrosin n=1 Tax=Xenopus tropicalis TaxID=8364 RepID=A0A6I8S3L0_XENTR|nr:probable fibrosin-1 isoform X3 [Xenopus tropicalis]KAE8578662.1 hypothetical protein XENTR_v10023720 [Xenopus tropicalis]|eukprot:XP_012825512.1 PREDICTED: probable fibrosin-1 isoform X3 [Xenopus tropicalis]